MAMDLFSVLRQNLSETTANLNALLLMGDEEERRILEYSHKTESKKARWG
jgi:hypothetical protein